MPLRGRWFERFVCHARSHPPTVGRDASYSAANPRWRQAARGLAGSRKPRLLELRQAGARTFAVFGPQGVRYESTSATQWQALLPANKGYLSVTVAPDDQAATLDLLARHAYAFLEDTRAEGSFDVKSGQVQTRFTARTSVMEGPDHGPLLGLYPHHWHDNPQVLPRLGPTYETVRGPIRLLASANFNTHLRYSGFVPWWPAVADGPRSTELRDVMKTDLRNARPGETSAVVRQRVMVARERQRERFAHKPRIGCNARMGGSEMKQFCALDASTAELLKHAMTDLNLSARAYDRVLRVARTIADLAASDTITADHMGEAIQYRSLDRRLWG